jgi:polyhydroxybutyrate depolymerase
MTRWPLTAAALAVTLLLSTACASSGRSLDAPGHEPVTRTVTVTTAQGQRTAIVHHPPSALANAPLIVMLHGGFGSGQQAEQSYGWDQEADAKGFVVAYPNGVDRAWNAGSCCGAPQSRGIDDAAFLHALTQRLIADDGVARDRVYAVGMSNGAMMTYAWACAYPHDLAGLGPVAGSLMSACSSPSPITVIAVHGTADQNVPIDGGIGPNGVTHVSNPSLEQTLAPFQHSDGCPASGTPSGTAPVAITTWTCQNGTRIVTAVITGAGHQWPGGADKPVVDKVLGLDRPDTHLNATDYLWQQLISA